MLPGILLVAAYVLYIVVLSWLRPQQAPAMPEEEIAAFRQGNFAWKVFEAFLLPMLLIVAVLGSIFAGIASPTEAAAVGAMGAIVLTALQGKLNFAILQSVMRETTLLTCMVFVILMGATTFSFVFREMEGDRFLVELIGSSQLSALGFLLLVMGVVFVAGFFIDFIEIIFIIVPVVAPIFAQYDLNLVWVGILLAMNLQTSFLTPPFGFSLFYLKGVAPKEVTTQHLYRGIVPFVLIQLLFLAAVLLFPDLVLFVLD